jgi:hypothetical protein
MLCLHPNKRTESAEPMHPVLDGRVQVQDKIDVIRRAGDEEVRLNLGEIELWCGYGWGREFVPQFADESHFGLVCSERDEVCG